MKVGVSIQITISVVREIYVPCNLETSRRLREGRFNGSFFDKGYYSFSCL